MLCFFKFGKGFESGVSFNGGLGGGTINGCEFQGPRNQEQIRNGRGILTELFDELSFLVPKQQLSIFASRNK